MGQRLNIEIIDSNYKVLANCYYHNNNFWFLGVNKFTHFFPP